MRWSEATKTAAHADESSQMIEVNQAELMQRERISALVQLAGGVAHQIRNPLGAIANAAAVLNRFVESEPDSDGRRALEIIQEEVRHANRIISELLNYARLRLPTPSEYVLSELIEGALALRPAPVGVDVFIDVHTTHRVRADFDQLLNALGNLLANAYEAMPTGGEFSIRSLASSESPMIEIELADSGPGVPDQEIERIFEPLVTLKPLGVGLGLATARALIENQGGAITCSNRTEGGARFILSVPAA